MGFNSIGKYIPAAMRSPLGKQAAVGLALEAGGQYVAALNPALASRVRLVSVRGGTIHAISISAPAAAELKTAQNGLFLAMEKASGLKFTDLKISLRGALVKPEVF